MISIEEAYQHLEAAATALFNRPVPTERLPSHLALNRVLAQEITCGYASPPFDASAMDGIAYKHEDGRTQYTLVGTVAAGDTPDAITPQPGECCRIMTGAPVPSTTDTVQMVERLSFDANQVTIEQLPKQGANIRFHGENTAVGDKLYEPGTRITPGILAGLVTQGVRFVDVRAPLKVGVAATGDEVVDYRRPLKPGQIYNSNGPTIHALLNEDAVQVQQLGDLGDEKEQIEKVLEANTDLDILILSGGVSMGNFDLVPAAAESAGFECVFHKIHMRPGKPLWFGRHPSGTLLFGLPGNPVSAMVGALLYVRPTIQALLSNFWRKPLWAKANLAEDYFNKARLPCFIGATLESGENGLLAYPLKTSGSGDILRFSPMHSLLRLESETRYNWGDAVQVLLPF